MKLTSCGINIIVYLRSVQWTHFVVAVVLVGIIQLNVN